MRAIRAIGLMSGTSLDGVDVALIETDGERVMAMGPAFYRPYGPVEREILRQALVDAVPVTNRDARPGVLAEAEELVTTVHAEAVETFLDRAEVARESVAVVGFHGQTVLHRPAERLTIQLGNGPELARRVAIPVVYDFRAADLAAGGQGAPLVPIYHQALALGLDRPRPIAVLNVGGVANVTYINGAEAPIACDTGPGNALLDDFMLARAGEAYDSEGRTAAEGRVDEGFVAAALAAPFFSTKPPKSLDRNHFRIDVAAFSMPDGAATLTALTAAAAARIVPYLPSPPRSWIVAGGGARNPTLLNMLAERLAPATVETADDAGWSAEHLEAQAFAFLAVRSLRGLPLTFPSTTGVAQPLTGGTLVKP